MRALFLAALLIAGCSPAPEVASVPTGVEQAGPQGIPVQDEPGRSVPEPTAAERQACDARGGRMQRAGMLGRWRCTVSYADAGKRCTDGDQCQGDCLLPDGRGPADPNAAVAGQCQADDNPFGCKITVEDGRVGAGLCVD